MSSSADGGRHSLKSNRSAAKSGGGSGGRGLLRPPTSASASGCRSLVVTNVGSPAGSLAGSLAMIGASSNLGSVHESRDSLTGSTKLTRRPTGETISSRSRRKSEMSRAMVAKEITRALTVNFEDKDEHLVETTNKKDKQKDTDETQGETTGLISSNLWSKDGGEMLSSEYVKGLNQRLFIGGSKNVDEHKKLIRDMQLLKRQRHQHLRKTDHVISQQRQKIMKGKEDFQKMIAAASHKSKKKSKGLAPMSLPRLFHPDFTHRKTQVPVTELAALARPPRVYGCGSASSSSSTGLTMTATAAAAAAAALYSTSASPPPELQNLGDCSRWASLPPSRLGCNILASLHEMPAKLFKLGLQDETEGAAVELLLEIKDALETLSQRGSKSSSKGSLYTSMDGELHQMIMANRRKEIVETILEQTRERQEKKFVGSFSKNNLRKASNMNTDYPEEDPDQTRKILELQSKLLQSHPFVTQAILLGSVIPANMGGLGGRDFGREEKKAPKIIKTEGSSDSFDVLQQEETKKGYCTVLSVLSAINLVETKSVKERISKWCRQMASEKNAIALKRTKYKPPNDLYPLRGI